MSLITQLRNFKIGLAQKFLHKNFHQIGQKKGEVFPLRRKKSPSRITWHKNIYVKETEQVLHSVIVRTKHLEAS